MVPAIRALTVVARREADTESAQSAGPPERTCTYAIASNVLGSSSQGIMIIYIILSTMS
jgi:hypothetical protein